MQDSERLAVAREDERAGIAAFRKVARRLAVVVDDRLPRLESELGAGIGLHARVAAKRKISRVAVLADDIERLAVLVLSIRSDDELARDDGMDGELEVGRDILALANGSNRPEAILKLAGGVLFA